MWELGPDADRPEWCAVESPFQKTLYEVVNTAAGPYAIGDGGTLIADRGDGWEIILDDGPKTRDNQLRGLAVTDDGKRIWFAGSSGALGCYDVTTRQKYDYSSPNEMTSTWEGIAVSGQAGSEKVLVANGSGEILPFTIDGFDQDWNTVRKPASKGSNVAGLAASPEGVGYAVDTSGNAFKTTASGWEDIGIVNAQVKFYDIYAGEGGRVYVAAGDGRIYRYDDSYRNWTPIGVGENALRSFDIYDGQMVVIGHSGDIYQRTGEKRWEQLPSPVDKVLFDIALGETDIIVGKAGTILHRPRGKPRDAGKSPDDDNYEGRGEHFDDDANAPGELASDDGGKATGSSSSTSDSQSSETGGQDTQSTETTGSDTQSSENANADATTDTQSAADASQSGTTAEDTATNGADSSAGQESGSESGGETPTDTADTSDTTTNSG